MKSDDLKFRIIPVIVACPLFLQNVDTSVMATALPSISEALHVRAVDLDLAIASYVISLAIFLPASAWLAERFGSRRVFCAAVLVFSLGSALCGIAGSLTELVVYRLLQGAGGAMMVPVGRTILLRSVPADRLLSAMVWYTLPAAFGRMAGPFFGGAIVTVASWHWIFLVNVPFGIIGTAMAIAFIEKDEKRDPANAVDIDLVGLGLLGVALLGVLGGLELAGKHLIPDAGIVLMVAIGAAALWLYVLHCRKHPAPILNFDVMRFPVFRTTTFGGFPLRVAALGALPFLLPLLLQLGLGMSPLVSGSISMCVALGGFATRPALSRLVAAFGFRSLLIHASLVAGMIFLAYSLFSPATSVLLICLLLVVGGFTISAVNVALTTLAYTDLPADRVPHAAAVAMMAQQLSIAIGVVAAASALSITGHVRHPEITRVEAGDFPVVFILAALLGVWSAWAFTALRNDDGQALRHQR